MTTTKQAATTANSSTIATATLGVPRIGPRRELKIALERYWSGQSSESALEEAGQRAAPGQLGQAKGHGDQCDPVQRFLAL